MIGISKYYALHAGGPGFESLILHKGSGQKTGTFFY
jgi:hypothetical protein